MNARWQGGPYEDPPEPAEGERQLRKVPVEPDEVRC